MKKLKSMCKINSGGFTLVELIVIIAILAFLMAILTPNIISYVAREKKYRAVEACKQAVSAANQLYDESVTYETTFTPDAIVKRAGLDSGSVKVEVVDGEVIHLYYKNGTESVVYCRYYDELDAEGNHVHHTIADSDPYKCDGTEVDGKKVGVHSELYNYLDEVDAISYYDDIDKDVFEGDTDGGSDNNVEFETESPTESTTNNGGGDDNGGGDNGDGDNDATTETTTTSSSSDPYTFDSNTNYAFGGDGETKVFQTLFGMLYTSDSNWMWNSDGTLNCSWLLNSDGTLNTNQGYTLKYDGSLASASTDNVMKDNGINVSTTSYKVGDKYYVVVTQGDNLRLGFDQNSSMTVKIDGVEKVVKQSPFYFLNIENGKYVKTSIADMIANFKERLVAPDDLKNLVDKLTSKAMSTADNVNNKAQMIEVDLNDRTKLCSSKGKRYVENGSTITLKEYVTTYADPTSSREVEPGDVYVDNVTKAIYVYWNANEIGKGWWRMGYYSGAPADGTEDAINEGLTYGSPNN